VKTYNVEPDSRVYISNLNRTTFEKKEKEKKR